MTVAIVAAIVAAVVAAAYLILGCEVLGSLKTPLRRLGYLTYHMSRSVPNSVGEMYHQVQKMFDLKMEALYFLINYLLC